jgi:hypothetical protein
MQSFFGRKQIYKLIAWSFSFSQEYIPHAEFFFPEILIVPDQEYGDDAGIARNDIGIDRLSGGDKYEIKPS